MNCIPMNILLTKFQLMKLKNFSLYFAIYPQERWTRSLDNTDLHFYSLQLKMSKVHFLEIRIKYIFM